MKHNTESIVWAVLGYIDVHLMAAAVLTDVPLWTFDKTLDKIAKKIGINYR